MRIVSSIDANGLFTGDVLLEEGEPLPAGTIDSRPPEGFHKPRWDGTAWVEGTSVAELLEKARRAKIAEIRSRVVLEASAIMPVWEFIYIIRTNVNDPRSATLDTIAQKGRNIEAYLNASSRTLAEIKAVTWDTWA